LLADAEVLKLHFVTPVFGPLSMISCVGSSILQHCIAG